MTITSVATEIAESGQFQALVRNAVINAATQRDRDAFNDVVDGLIRPTRIETLWNAATDLVIAEMQAA